MKKLIFLFLVIILAVPGSASARNITFPHSETFEGTWTDIMWTGTTGSIITKEALSWRGDGSYCAKIVPPNQLGGSGVNGDYGSLGKFEFAATPIFNVSFAIYFGTSINARVVNAGGGTYWKFVNITDGGDWAAMGRMVQYATYYEPSIVDFGGGQASIYWDGSTTGSTTGGRTGRLFLGNGSVNQYDKAGEWIWFNWIFNVTNDSTTVRIYTRDEAFSGNYFVYPNGPAPNMRDMFINFFNGYFPNRDANTYMLIDDLYMTNTATPHTIPTGFLTSGGDVTNPSITITSPTSNPTYSTGTTSTVSLGGTASDNVGVSSVTWACATCSPTSGTASGTTTWSISNIGLASGANAITVTAIDAASNTGTDSITVTYTPDTTAPVISNVSPSGVLECTTNPRDVTISATTNEAAVCRQGIYGQTWAQMTQMSTTGTTSHSHSVPTLSCGDEYLRAIICQDIFNNQSEPSLASWSIEEEVIITDPKPTTGIVFKGGLIFK